MKTSVNTNKRLPDWRCAVFIAPPPRLAFIDHLPPGWPKHCRWLANSPDNAEQWLTALEESAVHYDAAICIFVKQSLPLWSRELHQHTLAWQKNWRNQPWPARCLRVDSLAQAGWLAHHLARQDLLQTMSLDSRISALARRVVTRGRINVGFLGCHVDDEQLGRFWRPNYQWAIKTLQGLSEQEDARTLITTSSRGIMTVSQYDQETLPPKSKITHYCLGHRMLA